MTRKKRPKRKVATNEEWSNKKSWITHYAVLIGPLAGLLYPLPFASRGKNRIALNTSKLNQLWSGIYVRGTAMHAVSKRGFVRLPDRFAQKLDFDRDRIRRGQQGGIHYYSHKERRTIVYKRDRVRPMAKPTCDYCSKDSSASSPRKRCPSCKRLYCYRCRSGTLRGCMNHK